MDAPVPKPLREMTDAERRQLLRRRASSPAGGGMDLGDRRTGRRLLRAGGRLMIAAALLGAGVAGFVRFTASWRVALLVVGGMALYMLAVGRLVEGRTDRSD